MQHFERLRVHVGLARPVDTGVLHPVLGKELARTAGSKQFIPFLLKHAGCGKHVYLLLRRTGGEQDILLRNTVTHRKHRFKNSAGSITAYAPHLARRRHIHAQYGVCLLQAVEGELRSLDSYIIEVEQVLVRLLHGDAEHHFRSQFDKVYLEHLAYKGE